MTQQEIAQIITLARRAPLRNMAEAEVASTLLMKLEQFFAPPPDNFADDTQSSQVADTSGK